MTADNMFLSLVVVALTTFVVVLLSVSIYVKFEDRGPAKALVQPDKRISAPGAVNDDLLAARPRMSA